MKKIAVILTVFNRRQKTLACLEHLFMAQQTYNSSHRPDEHVSLAVFLTDDGCTDGTAEAIHVTFPSSDIRILKGTGSLFWAGGMRLAWQKAIDSAESWNYYLLINDDTYFFPQLFQILFETEQYCMKTFGRQGIYSGITCSHDAEGEITYGGEVYANWTKGRQILLQPTGSPQQADVVNANILLIPQQVVSSLGIFHTGFTHSCADYDYSWKARRAGVPVLVTASVCGACAYDHQNKQQSAMMYRNLSLADMQRQASRLTNSDRDYLLFVRRNLPLRYPVSWLVRKIRIYTPFLYYYINKVRGLYK